MTFVLADNVLDRLERSTNGESQVPIQADAKYLVNPGSVGQPRDGDPRAAYAIVDEDRRRVELYRLPYAVGAAQAKIIAAGLPEVLAQRLGLGR
jgi:diadenosine tetraphosphatase ApaH/serine/threonine PP2A family protein phosphatase